MKFTSKQYAQALMEALEGSSPKDEELILDTFAKTLAINNDLRLFEEIGEEFHKLGLAKKGIQQVEIKSAQPLKSNNEKEILDELNKLVKGKFEVKKTIDEKLIGGVVVRLEDQVIDASVKNQLEQLKKELTN